MNDNRPNDRLQPGNVSPQQSEKTRDTDSQDAIEKLVELLAKLIAKRHWDHVSAPKIPEKPIRAPKSAPRQYP